MTRAHTRSGALAFVLSIASITSFAHAVNGSDLISRIGPSIAGGTELRINGNAMAEMALTPTALLERVPLADGREVNLSLERFEILAADATFVHQTPQGEIQLPRPDVQLWRGTVAGEENSAVFLALSRQVGVNGYIITDAGVDIISSGKRGAQAPVIHRPAEVGGGAVFGTICQGALIAPGIEIPPERFTGERATGPCRNYRIAIDTDSSFTISVFDGNAADAQAYLAVLFGAVSEIYQRELNIRLQVPYIRTWQSDDPWSGGSTDQLLTQFTNSWNSTMSGVQRELAHLVVQRIRGGGIAWLGGICSSNGYGVSTGMNGFFPYPLQDHNQNNWDVMVVAHELGHNFGTAHTHDYVPAIDNCAQGECLTSSQGTIMSYCHLCPGGMSNIRLTFGPRIIARISQFTASRPSCGTSLPRVVSSPADIEVDEGDNVTLTGAVDGIGGGQYRWLRGTVVLSDNARFQGTTTPTLRITSATASEGGTYALRYTEACGTVTTSGAVVTVSPVCQPNEVAPTITAHPIGTIVPRGGTATFTAAATGTSAVAYQWRRNGSVLANSGRYSGTDTPTLRIDRVTSADAGSFHCVVSASGCRASTNPATLNVLPLPGAFSLTNPSDDERQVEVPTIFSWSASEDATSYVVVVDDDPSFASPLWEYETTNLSIQAPSDAIRRGKRHFWRVTAYNNLGQTNSNESGWSFVTRGPISDLNNDGVVDGKDVAFILLQWNATCTLGPTMECPDLSGDDRVGYPDLAWILRDLGFQRDDYTPRQWKQQMKKLYKAARPGLPGRSSTDRRSDQDRLINVIE